MNYYFRELMPQKINRIKQNDPDLTIGDLRGHSIVYTSMIALASALQQNTTLQQLRLSVCNIDDASADLLATTLKTNTSLEQIFLDGNRLSKYLCTFIGKFTQIQYIITATRSRNKFHQ